MSLRIRSVEDSYEYSNEPSGCIQRNRDTSVGIATGYRLDSRDSSPGRDKLFLFSAFRR
jgi:hypothetical protein